ncbi:alpha/beta hydrolase [Nonomuraea sp. MCN248]|uniref:Alpha/beta hydrolase n=1 Tax=Nonomuraea corallina TaxID=2989783 RepID=A0ABT4SAL7_9ACTN|nr:alpha/beta hydrolase [Nonomuraea corallina]MDA0633986.1 alpha/beta hydrolase [Nonomuraea corallina]
MATFALIHGGGGTSWTWRPLETCLRGRGHRTVAVDLPLDDPDAGLIDHADHVVADVLKNVGHLDGLVVVGHSWGGFVAPVVCHRTRAELLVLLAGMVPTPGEAPADWWEATGFGMVDIDDPIAQFMHDVPADLAAEALRHGRDHAEKALVEPWPLDRWPDVPTRYLLCRDDRWFPPEFVRPMVRERLGVEPDEIGGSHSVMLSRPEELADRLIGYL